MWRHSRLLLFYEPPSRFVFLQIDDSRSSIFDVTARFAEAAFMITVIARSEDERRSNLRIKKSLQIVRSLHCIRDDDSKF